MENSVYINNAIAVELAKIFKRIVVSDSEVGTDKRFTSSDRNQLFIEALKRGYVISPDALTGTAADFIADAQTDFNSTFYRSWDDITRRSREEIFIHQICHYLSVSLEGAGWDTGIYLPSDDEKLVLPESEMSKYTVIRSCTLDEMLSLCVDMLSSGIALKKRTIDVLCTYIFEVAESIRDIDRKRAFGRSLLATVANREALTQIYDYFGLLPSRKFDLLRYIMYKTTGSSELIKNEETVKKIQTSQTQFDFTRLDSQQLIQLSTIFYRFKPLFCAFKKSCKMVQSMDKRRYRFVNHVEVVANSNAPVINKIRRLAETHHTPLEKSFMQSVLSTMYDANTVYTEAAKLNNFQLVTLINALNFRMGDAPARMPYVVRNGKIFFKEGKKDYSSMAEYYAFLKYIFKSIICGRLNAKAGYVILPDKMTVTCPTSEKNFVGEYPFGSSYDFTDDSFFGIYWRNEWGTHDFDLSYVDEHKARIGWNSRWTADDKSVIFSGDVTEANPEATEILAFRKYRPNGIVYVNRFRGSNGSKFRVFFGNQQFESIHKNYMVDPDNVALTADCFSDSEEQMVGVMHDSKFYFCDFRSGASRVSSASKFSGLVGVTASKVSKYLTLEEILRESGFKIVKSEAEVPLTEDGKYPDVLDFRDFSKSDIIELFS